MVRQRRGGNREKKEGGEERCGDGERDRGQGEIEGLLQLGHGSMVGPDLS